MSDIVPTFPVIRHEHSKTCFYELQLTAPSLLTKGYWERHQLGWGDIKTLLSYVPSQYVWISCLQYGVQCPWSYIKVSYSNPGDVTINGKKHATKCIQSKLKGHHKTMSKLQSTLTSTDKHDQVTPPVPMYSVPYLDYKLLLTHLNPYLMPRYLYRSTFDIPTISFLYKFIFMEWMVTGTQADAIQLCRVVPVVSTVSFYPTMNNAPSVGYYQGTLYATTDEYIMVYPADAD